MIRNRISHSIQDLSPEDVSRLLSNIFIYNDPENMFAIVKEDMHDEVEEQLYIHGKNDKYSLTVSDQAENKRYWTRISVQTGNKVHDWTIFSHIQYNGHRTLRNLEGELTNG